MRFPRRFFPGAAFLALSFSYSIAGNNNRSIAVKKIEGDGKAGSIATRILNNALVKAGGFRLVPNPNGVPVASAKIDGNKLVAELKGAEGKTLFTREYERGNLELDALQFADDITLALTNVPGIATSQIVFVVTRNRRRELFVCDYDGRNARPFLPGGGESNVAPAISPDGSKLAFTQLNRGAGSLVLFDFQEESRVQLTDEPVAFAQSAWSPDGKMLAVALAKLPQKQADLHLIRFRGRQAPRIVLETPVSETRPSWSPDGDRIVYSAPIGGNRNGLFFIKPDQRSPQPEAFPTGFANSSSPAWSPDGRQVAFVSTDSRGRKSICIAYPEGGRQPRRVTAGTDPAWGADSRHLVFTTGWELRSLDLTTGKTAILVKGIGSISEPTWTR
ncbi:MAG: hypothetical protein HKN23_16650 [Verrucomicrobiales bacterium]|nr:hypothetical protein [Verrucomicrobiales bacterium]